MTLVHGEGTYFAPTTRVLVYAPGEHVEVGKYCSIAADVTIMCGGAHRTSLVSTYPFDCLMRGSPNETSRTYKHQKPTRIGNDVWIAHGAMIMAGLTIGDGAVIGPGSVVFRDVGPYEVVRGNPAKWVRHRHSLGVIQQLLEIRWWDWPPEVIRERIEDFYGPVQDFLRKYDSGQG